MNEFGLALNLAGATYCLTIVPAVAYFCSYGFAPRPEPVKPEEQTKIKKRMLRSVIRDMSFLILSLVLLYVFLANGSLTWN